MNTLPVLDAVLPVFGVLALGTAIRRANWLTEEADASLLRLTINLLVPCLAFVSILGNRALQQPGNLIIAPLVGFGTVMLGFAGGWFASRAAGLSGSRSRRTFAYVAGLYNYGYMALPLALALFHSETAGVLFVHNIGVETAMWLFAPVMLGERRAMDWRKIANVPLYTIIATLLLNFIGAPAVVPAFIPASAQMLGACAIPMGLVLVGATMADHAGEFHPRKGWRVMTVACLFRLGLMPVVFLAVAWALPCSLELKSVIVIQAAMPCAVLPAVLSKHYGGDTPTALRAVIATCVVSLLTVPLWLPFGMRLINVPMP